MSRGYLILVQNNETDNYLRMAYALALSIKNTQTTVNQVCIATDIDINNIPEHYKSVFDHIVSIPWTDHAATSDWKIENKWKYYYMTPFDETVILDADMVFTSDVGYWWDILSTKDICITNKPITYRGDVITSTKYRTVFESNNLPNVYTAFMYFKKNEKVAELFTLLEIIFNNWEKFYYEYLDENRPKHLSGDVAYALAIKLLGIEGDCFSDTEIPTFVHMKSYLQGINEKFISEDWTQSIPTYFLDDGSVVIGNYRQTMPFHYHVKNWLTDEILSALESRRKAK